MGPSYKKRRQSQSQIGQSWSFSARQDDWIQLSIGVEGDTATLYTKCSDETTKQFDRKTKAMKIDSTYNFYVAKGDLFGREYQVNLTRRFYRNSGLGCMGQLQNFRKNWNAEYRHAVFRWNFSTGQRPGVNCFPSNFHFSSHFSKNIKKREKMPSNILMFPVCSTPGRCYPV